MNVLGVVHHDDVGLGVLDPVVVESGHQLEVASFAAGHAPRRAGADYDAVFVLGGRMQVDQEDRLPWLRAEKQLITELLDASVPVLGICLGAQLIAEVRGGEVGPVARPERGWHEVELSAAAEADPLFRALPARFRPLVWHSYGFQLPPGAQPLATRPTTLQAFRLDDVPAWGMQWHVEPRRDAVMSWIDEAAALGLEAETRLEGDELATLRHDTERRIGAANDIARQIGAAFLQVAGAR
jgi:GMP synthase (glutamine-hydrolysing)